MSYKLANGNIIINLANGRQFPIYDGNVDYEEYKVWLLNGNTPQPVDSLSADDIWNKIKAERDRRINSGGYKVGAKWFHSDLLSRSQHLGMVMLGASIPANLQWKTMDGSFITMTQELAGQVFASATASDIAIFSAAESHKAAMESSAEPAAYDYLTGWPLVYGE